MKNMLHKKKKKQDIAISQKKKSALREVKILLIGSLIILSGITGACKKEGASLNNINCGTGDWGQLVEKELKLLLDLALNYSLDPSKANCDKYKKAGLDYIDALGKIKPCVSTIGIKDYNKQLEEAKKSIEEIDCQ